MNAFSDEDMGIFPPGPYGAPEPIRDTSRPLLELSSGMRVFQHADRTYYVQDAAGKVIAETWTYDEAYMIAAYRRSRSKRKHGETS